MSYITIDLNKMSDAGKIAYLVDLIRDMRDVLSGDQSYNVAELIAHADKAAGDYERGQDIKQFMNDHFQLITIGGK